MGGASRLMSLEAAHMPRLLDKFMNLVMFRQQQSRRPVAAGRSDALYEPDGTELQQRQGGRSSKVHERSPYTFLSLRSRPLGAVLVVAGAAWAVWKSRDPGTRAGRTGPARQLSMDG